MWWHVYRVRLIDDHGKHDWRSSRDTEKPSQDMTLTSFINSIADLNIKTWLEEKLHELDSKNDTIHVCLLTLPINCFVIYFK